MTLSANSVTATTFSPPLSSVSEQQAGWLLIRAAENLLKSLSRGQAITAPMMRDAMVAAFGGFDSAGAWTWKLAYEALEAAQVMFLRRYLSGMKASATTPEQLLSMLGKLAALTPTQTRRSEESALLQQFSTPIELAAIAVSAAAITANDVVLEPSAGTGILAVHADVTGAWVVLNELADTRARMLELLFPGAPVTRFNAEHIDDRLPEGFAPSVVLMNPPFSAAPNVSGTHAGVDLRHIRSAINRLAPGGRLVAITSFGLTPSNAKYEAAFRELAKTSTLVFTAGLATGFFKRHGTSIETRMLVFDKHPEPLGHVTAHALCNSFEELARALPHNLPPRLPVAPTFTPVFGAARFPNPQAKSTPSASTFGPAAPPAVSPRNSADLKRSPSPSVVGTSKLQARSGFEEGMTAVELTYEVIETPEARMTSADALYEPYAPERIRIPGAKPHPTKLVQSAAMASVVPPIPTYRPHLLPGVVENGLLSDAQLETLIYAGEAHEKFLMGHWRLDEAMMLHPAAEADGTTYRRAFFIGDGTGSGKGRQVTGIVLDNWLKGRRRALWISKSEDLLEDAQRDWSDLGMEKLLVVPQARYKPTKPITLSEGVLFTTYATLRSETQDGVARVDQLVKWLGQDFDGVIIFDEAHAMGNAAPSNTDRGQQRGSQQGIKGLHLQRLLPKARIVYVSATGATVVENLAYAERLGLWGSDDLPFDTRQKFVSAMHEGGVAAAEVLARDLKSLGFYTARSLSYEGIEVDILEHELTSAQVKTYDAYADAYQLIHANLTAALMSSNVTGDEGTRNPQAKSAAMSAFEGAKLRFFQHLITGMKVPSLIRAAETDLAAGDAVVVQLVSTSEAVMDRRLADIPPTEWNDLSIDVTPREYIFDYLKSSFPTQLYEVYTDENGKECSRPVVDAMGNPVQCRDAVRRRDRMIEHLAALAPVQSALDQLIQHFGTDMVAEVTGRSRRIVKRRAKHGDVLAVETRPGSANIAETQAFMDNLKRILIFSDAGGTGRSYHADLGAVNQRRRIHYLLEGGWIASNAIQGLGRTNRTNQAHPPRFRPVTTNVRGERRFISTISRRLDSLGAITRGERKTGGQGLYKASDSLENRYAYDALRHFYRLMIEGKIACCSLQRFTDATGLRLTSETGALLADPPPLTRFLNRLLALQISLQNELFAVFEALIAARVESAIAGGTYDVGLETISADSIMVAARNTIATNAATGAITEILEVKRRERNTPLTGAKAMEMARAHGSILVANTRSGRAAVQIPWSSLTLDDGTVKKRVLLLRPMEQQAVGIDDMLESSWGAADAETFTRLWEDEIAKVPTFKDSRFHIITGLLLPIWKRLPMENPRIYRFVTDEGENVIGRLVPPECLDAFDAPASEPLNRDEVWEQLMSGIAFTLEPDLRLRKVMSMGRTRFELTNFDADALDRFKAMGLFTEMISYRTCLFVPVSDEGKEALARLLSKHPVLAS